jgi:hypothetical protein
VNHKKIDIQISYSFIIGEVNLNEIVYRLQELRDTLMLKLLEKILINYDDIISGLLSERHRSSERKGLGQHFKKGSRSNEPCRGRKVTRSGYRGKPRHIATPFGELILPVRVVECSTCGAQYSPLLAALQVGRYRRKEDNFERAVVEAVIDTNYRRLINGHGIAISLGGIHNIVVGSDIEREYKAPVALEELKGIMADGTGVKQKKGRKGELRTVIGINQSGKVVPLGCFVNTSWEAIEKEVKKRIKQRDDVQTSLPFIFDGEPGLDNFLSTIATSQRCSWHGSRGLYHALWEDGIKKKESKPATDKVRELIGIELPAGDYELLKEEDKQAVREHYERSKAELEDLIKTFQERGYEKGVTYLEGLSRKIFTNIEIWLNTGIISPKTTSLLERAFREIGRRLKKIAWGWSDKAVTNLSKMIMIKQYAKDKWEEFWKEKLGIKGYFHINIVSIEIV